MPLQTYFMTTSVSFEERAFLEPVPDADAEAERSAARSDSVMTEIVISLFRLDCMRYSVNSESTLICLQVVSACNHSLKIKQY